MQKTKIKTNKYLFAKNQHIDLQILHKSLLKFKNFFIFVLRREKSPNPN